jgi:TPR repeat protein
LSLLNQKTPEKQKLILNPWVVGVACTILSWLGGYWSAVYQDEITLRIEDHWCHGIANLAAGKLARKTAVELYLKDNGRPTGSDAKIITEKHKEANSAFQSSEECGVAEAGAFLGQAYCYGWGVDRNPGKGFRMIQDAARKVRGLGSEWSSDEAYCPLK